MDRRVVTKAFRVTHGPSEIVPSLTGSGLRLLPERARGHSWSNIPVADLINSILDDFYKEESLIDDRPSVFVTISINHVIVSTFMLHGSSVTNRTGRFRRSSGRGVRFIVIILAIDGIIFMVFKKVVSHSKNPKLLF